VALGALNPPCATLGVAAWILMGGGWRANGFALSAALLLASTNWASGPAKPSSAAGALVYADGGKRGDFMCCEKDGDMGPKPGVLGADWVRSWAR
jgi:hypothetical protein